MTVDLVQIRALAETKEDENSRFRQFVSKHDYTVMRWRSLW